MYICELILKMQTKAGGKILFLCIRLLLSFQTILDGIELSEVWLLVVLLWEHYTQRCQLELFN